MYTKEKIICKLQTNKQFLIKNAKHIPHQFFSHFEAKAEPKFLFENTVLVTFFNFGYIELFQNLLQSLTLLEMNQFLYVGVSPQDYHKLIVEFPDLIGQCHFV